MSKLNKVNENFRSMSFPQIFSAFNNAVIEPKSLARSYSDYMLKKTESIQVPISLVYSLMSNPTRSNYNEVLTIASQYGIHQLTPICAGERIVLLGDLCENIIESMADESWADNTDLFMSEKLRCGISLNEFFNTTAQSSFVSDTMAQTLSLLADGKESVVEIMNNVSSFMTNKYHSIREQGSYGLISIIENALRSGNDVDTRIFNMLSLLDDSIPEQDESDYDLFQLNVESDVTNITGVSPAMAWVQGISIDLDINWKEVKDTIVKGVKKAVNGIKKFFTKTVPDVMDKVSEWVGDNVIDPEVFTYINKDKGLTFDLPLINQKPTISGEKLNLDALATKIGVSGAFLKEKLYNATHNNKVRTIDTKFCHIRMGGHTRTYKDDTIIIGSRGLFSHIDGFNSFVQLNSDGSLDVTSNLVNNRGSYIPAWNTRLEQVMREWNADRAYYWWNLNLLLKVDKDCTQHFYPVFSDNHAGGPYLFLAAITPQGGYSKGGNTGILEYPFGRLEEGFIQLRISLCWNSDKMVITGRHILSEDQVDDPTVSDWITIDQGNRQLVSNDNSNGADNVSNCFGVILPALNLESWYDEAANGTYIKAQSTYDGKIKMSINVTTQQPNYKSLSYLTSEYDDVFKLNIYGDDNDSSSTTKFQVLVKPLNVSADYVDDDVYSLVNEMIGPDALALSIGNDFNKMKDILGNVIESIDFNSLVNCFSYEKDIHRGLMFSTRLTELYLASMALAISFPFNDESAYITATSNTSSGSISDIIRGSSTYTYSSFEKPQSNIDMYNSWMVGRADYSALISLCNAWLLLDSEDLSYVLSINGYDNMFLPYIANVGYPEKLVKIASDTDSANKFSTVLKTAIITAGTIALTVCGGRLVAKGASAVINSFMRDMSIAVDLVTNWNNYSTADRRIMFNNLSRGSKKTILFTAIANMLPGRQMAIVSKSSPYENALKTIQVVEATKDVVDNDNAPEVDITILQDILSNTQTIISTTNIINSKVDDVTTKINKTNSDIGL